MPGVGKTTLASRVVELVDRPCGFLTLEVREGGSRVGFDVVDIYTRERSPLARVGVGQPSVGRYVVFLDTCKTIEVALSRKCDVLVIDEIGAMEFRCANFMQSLQNAVVNTPRVLATVHRNYVQFAKSLGFEILWLTRDNWNYVFREVLRQLQITP